MNALQDTWLQRARRWWRHHWISESASRRAVPPEMAQRLQQRIAASESRHSGQICVCIEGALPDDALRRAGREAPLSQVVRERALSWFGQMQVWDTEYNNGVLIYLLLAERRIEIVADRGIARHVGPAQWQEMVSRLSRHLKAADYEQGLTMALEEVSALQESSIKAEWRALAAQVGDPTPTVSAQTRAAALMAFMQGRLLRYCRSGWKRKPADDLSACLDILLAD